MLTSSGMREAKRHRILGMIWVPLLLLISSRKWTLLSTLFVRMYMRSLWHEQRNDDCKTEGGSLRMTFLSPRATITLMIVFSRRNPSSPLDMNDRKGICLFISRYLQEIRSRWISPLDCEIIGWTQFDWRFLSISSQKQKGDMISWHLILSNSFPSETGHVSLHDR
jgi:hypothetical protein